MGVKSDGSYGVDAGLFYSFPVLVDAAAAGDGVGGGRGAYSIVRGLELDADVCTHIAQTTRRLRAELDKALAIDDEMPAVAFDDPKFDDAVFASSAAAESDTSRIAA